MPLWPAIILGATVFVAYANGANDNFKGVATLLGSGTTDYRKALGWATITTLAGSVTAFFLATELISIFQGKGLVPSELSESEPFVAAVVLGAALTVMLATKIGLPISTTHSLTGALFGSGLVAVGLDLGFKALAINFFMPLLLNAGAVARTVSKKITGMEPNEGLWANLVSSFLVVVASKWGVPVSTTHVSCGALFAIGIVNGRAQWRVIRTILMAWLLTLPTAAVLSAGVYLMVRQF